MSVKGHRTKPGDTETSRTLQGGTPRNKPGTCPISAQGTQRGQVWPCSSHCAPECCPQVLGALETCRGPGGDRTSCLLETWRVPRGDTEGGSKCAKGGGWQQGPPPHSQGALCRRWDAPRCPRSGLVWGLRMLTGAGTAGCPPHPTEGQSRGQTWGGSRAPHKAHLHLHSRDSFLEPIRPIPAVQKPRRTPSSARPPWDPIPTRCHRGARVPSQVGPPTRR